MGRSNGIGSQFVQLIEGADFRWKHFWWEAWDEMPSDVEASVLLSRRLFSARFSRLWPMEKGRGRLVNLLPDWNLPGAAWRGQQLTKEAEARYFLTEEGTFDVALVAPISEEEAAFTLSVLGALGCPYVFQVWDIMHREGLDAGQMPSFTALLRGAEQVVGLTASIASEVNRVYEGPVELMSFGRQRTEEVQEIEAEDPFRLAVLGFLSYYEDGVDLLARAWERVRAVSQGARLVVIGREDQLRYLPDGIRRDVEFHCFPADEERDRILRSCHAAYLPGPLSATTALGRFSIPCRIADYLHLGLPLVGAVARENATALFLEEIRGRGFFPAVSVDELGDVLVRLSQPKVRSEASKVALAFAHRHLDIETIRPRLLEILAGAAGVAR
ncbi:MAG: glycosyltransferase [Verrucomicrobiota bacterium]